MTGYKTRNINVNIGAFKAKIRALSDHNQFYDPQEKAKQAGICSASWSLFGQLWQASKVLAQAVKQIDIDNRRIIEIGCGLALPSLVLQYRGADITASDHHPLSKKFLNKNSKLNNLMPVPYLDLPWGQNKTTAGPYDLIIGSDILYEPNHSSLLASLIKRIASPKAKVLISCPGRGYRNQLSRKLKKIGFSLKEKPVAFEKNEQAPYRGRLLMYQRG